MPAITNHVHPPLTLILFGLGLWGPACTSPQSSNSGANTSAVGSGDGGGDTAGDSVTAGVGSETDGDAESGPETTGDGGSDEATGNSGEGEENSEDNSEGSQDCSETGRCAGVDILVVLDNSGTMGEEQRNLARNLPALVDEIGRWAMVEGDPSQSIRVMSTSVDLGHPICTPFEPENYIRLTGAPQERHCLDRIDDFVGLGEDPPDFTHVCEEACDPERYMPADSFVEVSFDGQQSNVTDNQYAEAIECTALQGVCGCGYESPLEAMMQALQPDAKWNDPDQVERPFLRPEATLAIVLLTDEPDCSVLPPAGWDFFTDPSRDDFWAIEPDSATKKATSAICWNGGVECEGGDSSEGFEHCQSVDHGVLQPVERYTKFLTETLRKDNPDKDIVMLSLVGVPPVTEHAEQPPYHPLEGGQQALVYRDWRASDILPDDPDSVEQKQFEFGIGPGCTGRNADGEVLGQATPPVRILEVCEALNEGSEPSQQRCCVESICDADFSSAMRCLFGTIQVSREN